MNTSHIVILCETPFFLCVTLRNSFTAKGRKELAKSRREILIKQCRLLCYARNDERREIGGAVANIIISYTRNKISYKRRARKSCDGKGGTVGAGSMGWPATSGGWIGWRGRTEEFISSPPPFSGPAKPGKRVKWLQEKAPHPAARAALLGQPPRGEICIPPPSHLRHLCWVRT